MKTRHYFIELILITITTSALIIHPARAGNFIEVEPGVEIYYEDKGSSRPIVFVPGWTFTTEVFAQQLDYFSKTHRVVVVDPRSQGRSTVTLEGNDYVTHASDLAKLIKTLELEKVILVGWSFGCLETWGYIKQEGLAKVSAHVCIDLSPKTLSVNAKDWVEGPLDDIAGAYHTFLRSPKGQREFVTWYTDEIMVQRDLTSEEMFWVVDQSLQSPPYVAAALFASGMFSNNMEEAKLLDESLPSLFVVAEHWSENALPFLKKHFPNTKTAVLGGHMMFWEYPEKFNQILEDFINSAKTQ